MSLDRLINLAKRTGDRLIVHDPIGGNDIVIMNVDEYEMLLADEQGARDLTGWQLLNQINRDIAIWRANKEAEENYDSELWNKETDNGRSFFDRPEDNFGWHRTKAAWTFGVAVLLLGIPCVLSQEAFGEFDYWVGTISLVIFAIAEIILFAWVFGMEKGWKEITHGADIVVPRVFKHIIKYVTPVFLLVVFIGSLPEIWATLTKKITTYVFLARILLVALFAAISALVYAANKKKVAV